MLLRLLAVLLFVAATTFAATTHQIVRSLRFGADGRPVLVEGRDGAIYCTNGNNIVYRLGRDGSFRVINRFEDPYTVVTSLVAAPDGHLYGSTGTEFFRLTYSGLRETLQRFTPDDFGYTTGVTELVNGPDTALYGILRSSKFGDTALVIRVTLDGALSIIASLGPSPFLVHTTLTVGPDGALWAIHNGAVVRVTLDGVVSAGVTSGFIPNDARWLVSHPDGYLYCGGINLGEVRPQYLVKIGTDGTGTLVRRHTFVELPIPKRTPVLGNDGNFFFYGVAITGPAPAPCLMAMTPGGDILRMAGPLEGKLATIATHPLVATYDGWLYATSFPLESRDGVIVRALVPGRPQRNMPPLARADFRRPPAPGKSIAIDFLANDSDVNGDPLTITNVGQPKSGTVLADPNSRKVFYSAPVGDPVGVDEFSYTISDGKGGTAFGRVTIRADVRGTFSSLLEGSPAYDDGHLSVTLGGFGAVTARLWLGGYVAAFSGRFNELNQFTQAFSDRGTETVLMLELRYDGNEPVIDASLSNRGSLATLTRPRPAAAAARAGSYTFVIPNRTIWKSQPGMLAVDGDPDLGVYFNPFPTAQGNGFGTLKMLPSGAAIVAGRMPDGAAFAGGMRLDTAGRLIFFAPLYTPTYPPQGWVRGIVSFGPKAGVSDADGDLLWVHPSGYYENFGSFLTAPVDFLASRYTPPAQLQDTLGSTVNFAARDGGLTQALTTNATLTGNTLIGTAALRMNGKFSPSSGLVVGHLSPPGSARWRSFGGVLLQKQGRILGQFSSFGPRGAGGVSISAP